MKFDEVRKEVEEEKKKSIERWPKCCTNGFTKQAKRLLLEEIDNMVWNDEGEITHWCKRNKVYDEVAENENEETWKKLDRDNAEHVRLR